MKKQDFLREIQQEARLRKEIERIWTAAVETGDNDPRWKAVEAHPDMDIMINNFCGVFTVEPVKKLRRRVRKSHKEVLEERLSEAKSNLDKIKNLKWRAQAEADIKELERKIAEIE